MLFWVFIERGGERGRLLVGFGVEVYGVEGRFRRAGRNNKQAGDFFFEALRRGKVS